MIDNMGVHLDTWVELLAGLGVTMTADEFHHRFAGQTNPAIFRGIFGDRFDSAEIARMADEKEALYRERFADHLRPVAGLPELLTALEARGIPVGIASSGPSVNVFFALEGLGWAGRFGAIVTGDDISHCKPHPEAFLTTAEQLSVPPEQCLVFEDAPSGIQAAHRAGMQTIALTTTMQAATLEAMPSVVHVCNDFYGAMRFLGIA